MGDKIDEFKVAGKIKTTISGKMIYMLLNELADKDGVITISQKKIGKILGIHKTTVRRNLRRLERSKYILIHSRYTEDGGRLSNKYILR
ncbi:helix-turn-helix domain-containing protein [Clostridiaceae bacterium M8S5]|nr:helix-turn-helix domain-containing protein [Clostridiaceae bacterium M8S5]